MCPACSLRTPQSQCLAAYTGWMDEERASRGQHPVVPTIPLENVLPIRLLWGQIFSYHLRSLGYFRARHLRTPFHLGTTLWDGNTSNNPNCPLLFMFSFHYAPSPVAIMLLSGITHLPSWWVFIPQSKGRWSSSVNPSEPGMCFSSHPVTT